MPVPDLASAVAAGYVIGMFPTADLAARIASKGTVDLRHAGSGNPGGMNAAQVLGAGWGLAVIVSDIAKGALACVVGHAFAGGNGACWAGTAAVVGHCFPVWNRFRGGKGVAASVGQCLATFPAYFPIDLFVAVITAMRKRRAFTATTVSSIAWIACAGAWWKWRLANAWGPTPNGALLASTIVSSGVIFYKFWEAEQRTRRTPTATRTSVQTGGDV